MSLSSMSLNMCSLRETRGNCLLAVWKNVVMLEREEGKTEVMYKTSR